MLVNVTSTRPSASLNWAGTEETGSEIENVPVASAVSLPRVHIGTVPPWGIAASVAASGQSSASTTAPGAAAPPMAAVPVAYRVGTSGARVAAAPAGPLRTDVAATVAATAATAAARPAWGSAEPIQRRNGI